MPVSLTIDISVLASRLDRVRTAIDTKHRLLEEMGEVARFDIKQNFEEQGPRQAHSLDPTDALPWAENTMFTKAMKGGGKNRILEDSGALRNGFMVHFDGRGAVVTSSVPYAGTHQEGAFIADAWVPVGKAVNKGAMKSILGTKQSKKLPAVIHLKNVTIPKRAYMHVQEETVRDVYPSMILAHYFGGRV